MESVSGASSAGEVLSDAAGLKAELRRVVLARRDALDAGTRRALSAVIVGRLVALDRFEQAATVLAYCSFGSELDTEAFLAAVLMMGKRLVLPRVDRATRVLALHVVRDPGAELRPGTWGIREPVPAACPPVEAHEVDFVLVPGVAFDASGGRVGYGGGYYDRLVAGLAPGPSLVAAAFEVQLVERVPMSPHDRRVDRIVTERAVYPS